MRFMSINSKFHHIGTIVFDLMMLNILWIVMNIVSLGLLVGVTTTAMYHAINKSMIQSRENIYRCFFRMFKKRLIKASVVYLILLTAAILSYVTYWYMNTYFYMHSAFIILFAIQMLFIMIMSIYIFPLMAEKNMGIKEYFWMSYYLAFKYIHVTIIAIIAVLGMMYLLYVGPFISIIVLGVSVQAYVIAQLIFKQVFKHHFTNAIKGYEVSIGKKTNQEIGHIQTIK